jgi:hypothetical protein
MTLPIHLARLATDSVPEDLFTADLTQYQQIQGGTSSVSLSLRRDLEPWAASWRQLVVQLVREFMPYVPGDYGDWTLSSWVNSVEHGGRVLAHDHRPCDLAIVWYLSVPPNSGRFLLAYQGQQHRVDVAQGDVIAFPASITHSTEVNHSPSSRRVMATNVAWTQRLRERLAALAPAQSLDQEADRVYAQRQQQLIDQLITHGQRVVQ